MFSLNILGNGYQQQSRLLYKPQRRRSGSVTKKKKIENLDI